MTKNYPGANSSVHQVMQIVNDTDTAKAVIDALRDRFRIPGVDFPVDEKIESVEKLAQEIEAALSPDDEAQWMGERTARMMNSVLGSIEDKARERVSSPDYADQVRRTARSHIVISALEIVESLNKTDVHFELKLRSRKTVIDIPGPGDGQVFNNAVEAWEWANGSLYTPMPDGSGLCVGATLVLKDAWAVNVLHELEIGPGRY